MARQNKSHPTSPAYYSLSRGGFSELRVLCRSSRTRQSSIYCERRSMSSVEAAPTTACLTPPSAVCCLENRSVKGSRRLSAGHTRGLSQLRRPLVSPTWRRVFPQATCLAIHGNGRFIKSSVFFSAVREQDLTDQVHDWAVKRPSCIVHGSCFMKRATASLTWYLHVAQNGCDKAVSSMYHNFSHRTRHR